MNLFAFTIASLCVGALGASLQETQAPSAKPNPALIPVAIEEIVFDSTAATSAADLVQNDATSAPKPNVIKNDGSYIIKYPTVPETNENTPTAPPPGVLPDEPSIRMTDQAIITGEADCACGVPFTRTIVGGENATINEYPWTVALMRKKSDGTLRGPYCGGTLICDRYVVTASHCVDGFDASEIQVWLLEENFSTDDENARPTEKIDVSAITMHPEYDRRNIDNDIALLKLSSEVTLGSNNPHVPVCLPADNENTFEGEDATVAGWGATEMGGDVSPQLQKVTVPVISNKKCNWRSLYLGKITDNMLCAGELASGGKDSCQGDSGGPLVLERENKQLLVGIVSFGYGCAQPLAPGVYTRVSRYPEFIRENTQDCQYCKK